MARKSRFDGMLPPKTEEEERNGSDATPAWEREKKAGRKGRKPGKRSDPNYKQHSLYLPNSTHERYKMVMEFTKEERDFSELMDELLCRHLDKYQDMIEELEAVRRKYGTDR